MEKGGPSSAQLLELLQRAADELKTVRGAAAETSALLQQEQRAHAATQEKLELLRQQLDRTRATGAPLDQADVTGEMPKPDEAARGLGSSSGPATDPLSPKVSENTAELVSVRAALEQEQQARQAAAQSVADATAELERVKAELAAERQAHESARTGALGERHEAASAFERQLVLSRQAVNDARAHLDAERLKVATLETSLFEVNQARGELEAQLQQLEQDHAALSVKLESDLEAATAKARNEGEAMGVQALAAEQAAHQEEKQRHQGTAQKLLAERQKGRELEAALQESREAVSSLESATRSAADAHARALQEAQEKLAAHEGRATAQLKHLEAQVKQLSTQLADSQTRLVHAVEEQRFVERKYEDLHKELLQVMEQRDQLQRQLQAARR